MTKSEHIIPSALQAAAESVTFIIVNSKWGDVISQQVFKKQIGTYLLISFHYSGVPNKRGATPY